MHEASLSPLPLRWAAPISAWAALVTLVASLTGCGSMLGYDDVAFANGSGEGGDAGATLPESVPQAAAVTATGAPDGGPQACAPSCVDRTCGGSDGCGGKCTGCPASGLTCDPASWTCKNPACTGSCTGKSCGDSDGCGGVCTACTGGKVCNTASKQCVASCSASCVGKGCGDSDGCGGTCAQCPAGQTCNVSAKACQSVCVPNCGGKSCGEADGCGGKCTACPAAGQGCDTTTGTCAACTKSCGAHGSCVFAWEGGQHCQCEPGYYETYGGCVPVTGSACDGVTCGGHGTCFSVPPFFGAECHCEGNYVQYGTDCAPLDKIRCIDRDRTLKDKGAVRCSADDTGYEVCRDGDGNGTVEWVASGAASCTAGASCSACLGKKCDNGDGTGGQACPTGTVCMGKVHELDVYQCIAGCDCTNCGTCDPGQFNGYQRSCGSSANDFNSATVACKSPCPHANEGCLPYGQFSFCFPSEGCASASPH